MADYVVASTQEITEMLEATQNDTIEDLFAHIPKPARLKEKLNLPDGLSEMEVINKMTHMSDKNKVYPTIFRGAGAYKHYIPSVVNHLSSRSEYVTSYTPYQAEVAQGTLQTIFEFQTMITSLTGLYAANASMYDGANAAAEALMMTQDRKRHRVLISDTINPEVKDVLLTYCYCFDMPYEIIPSQNGLTDLDAIADLIDDETSCLYVEQLNFNGLIEDVKAISDIGHAHGIKIIMGANPIALALLPSAQECNVDICVGEGQPLGLPLSFGGPYLGFMSATKEMMRKLPGRIVGETTDTNGKTAYVLTLQAREQHIRREKASSSICSNQSLMAVRATIYCATLGPDGLRDVAARCVDNAHYLASKINQLDGISLKYQSEFFHEFVTTSSHNSQLILSTLEKHNILGGLPLNENDILWCATEMNTKQEMDQVIKLIEEVLS
ncbi:MAG: aminomethyl-transferring glycine dehydrogenase subunit GcvPA [Erysipelothrix sp.]|nr:aminomethyl-transferring glycine dehydrogenase subunit GcvPA [Erysipelothrix sp.]